MGNWGSSMLNLGAVDLGSGVKQVCSLYGGGGILQKSDIEAPPFPTFEEPLRHHRGNKLVLGGGGGLKSVPTSREKATP